MVVSPLVHSFPFVAWILLAALAFGTFFFAALTRWLSDATTGYLRFSAVSAAALALVTWLVDGGLTTPAGLVIKESTPELAAGRAAGLVVFALAAVAYAVLIRRARASSILGVVGLAVSLSTLAAAALGWAPTGTDAVPLLVQLSVLSVVTGGSLAAIALGHWYLVTPRISERPLLLQARMLLAGVGLQALLCLTWISFGGGPGQAAFSALQGGSVLLVTLRAVITIAFPLVLVYMAWRTAQTRSMESATGLLYITLAAVMAGTIGSAALYVSSGLLV